MTNTDLHTRPEHRPQRLRPPHLEPRPQPANSTDKADTGGQKSKSYFLLPSPCPYLCLQTRFSLCPYLYFTCIRCTRSLLSSIASLYRCNPSIRGSATSLSQEPFVESCWYFSPTANAIPKPTLQIQSLDFELFLAKDASDPLTWRLCCWIKTLRVSNGCCLNRAPALGVSTEIHLAQKYCGRNNRDIVTNIIVAVLTQLTSGLHRRSRPDESNQDSEIIERRSVQLGQLLLPNHLRLEYKFMLILCLYICRAFIPNLQCTYDNGCLNKTEVNVPG